MFMTSGWSLLVAYRLCTIAVVRADGVDCDTFGCAYHGGFLETHGLAVGHLCWCPCVCWNGKSVPSRADEKGFRE